VTAAGPVVVMGVAGSGKSTVARRLALTLNLHHVEADEYHPAENTRKMSQGRELTDDDRRPWLAALVTTMKTTMKQKDGRVVLSCSALRRSYRDLLREAAPQLWFLHLDVDPETARSRVASRPDHFMPPSLVDSQFAALEPLDADESGITIDARRQIDDIIRIAAARPSERSWTSVMSLRSGTS
jgi:gluconokinase